MEVEGVVKRLVDRRDLSAGNRAIERVLAALPLHGRDLPLRRRAELAEDGVGVLAVGLDVLLPREVLRLGLSTARV
jgi:hypothetical protein